MEGLLGQLIDFSYTIPVFNVTITKEIAFSYAEAHAAWGPMFALVLLILFGIIMTLIWLYLILSAACSCCCLLKKQGGGESGRNTKFPHLATITHLPLVCSLAQGWGGPYVLLSGAVRRRGCHAADSLFGARSQTVFFQLF